MSKRLLGLLAIAVLMSGLFFPGTEARGESFIVAPFYHLSQGADSYLDAPYDLKAVNSGDNVRLSWRNPQGNVTVISIERKTSGHSFREIAAVRGRVTKYTDDTVSPGTFYTYRILAIRDGQSSPPSNEAQVYTYDDANDYWQEIHEDFVSTDAPSNLTVTVLSCSSISLTWDGCSFPTHGYRVERRSNSGAWVTVANTGYRTRFFTDSGLDRYTRYYYRVQSYNLLADSDYSEEISVCTSGYYAGINDDRCWSGNYYYERQPVVIKLQVGSRKYYLNQTLGSMDTAPFISGGRTLVPVRFLAESIGAKVDWNDYEQKATISYDGEVIELWVGRSSARINGSRIYIDSSNAQLTPIIDHGRIMLPLRFITENLGFDVYWVDTSQEIILTCFAGFIQRE